MLRNLKEEFFKLRKQKLFFVSVLGFFLLAEIIILSMSSAYERYYEQTYVDIFEVEDNIGVERGYVKNYDQELAKSIDNLRRSTRSPLVRQNEILRRSIENQADQYEILKTKKLDLRFEDKRALELLVDSKYLDILLMVFIFIIGYMVFNFDRENYCIGLIASIEDGSKNRAKSKLLLFEIITIISAALLYTLLIINVKTLFGFGSFNRSIQSLMIFRDASLSLSIRDYILVFIGQKILATLFYGSILALIFSVFKDMRFQVLSSMIFVLINYLSYRFIDQYTVFSSVKYLSLFSHYNIFDLYGKYSDVYLYVGFVKRYIYSITVCLSAFIFANLASYKILKVELPLRKNSNRILKLSINPKSLFSFESYRICIESMGLIGALLLIVIALNSMPKERQETYDFVRMTYRSFVYEFEGKIDDGKIKALDDKKDYFASIDSEIQKINEDFDEGKINYRKRDRMIEDLEREQSKEIGFSKLYDQVKKSVACSGETENLYIMDEEIGNYHFVHNNYTLIASVLFYLLLIIVISETYIKDESLNISRLIKSTKRGHVDVIINRMANSYIIAIIYYIICQIYLYKSSLSQGYGLNYEAVVQSLPALFNFGINMSFLALSVLLVIYGLVSIIVLVNTIILVNLKIKKRIGVYLTTFILMILPNLIFIFFPDLKFLNMNPLSNIFSIRFTLSWINFVTLLIQILLSVLLAIISAHRIKRLWQAMWNLNFHTWIQTNRKNL